MESKGVQYLKSLPESDFEWLAWSTDQIRSNLDNLATSIAAGQKACDEFSKDYGREIKVLDDSGDVYEFLKEKKNTNFNQTIDAWRNSIPTVLRNLSNKMSTESTGGDTLKQQLQVDWSKGLISFRAVDTLNPPNVFLENGVIYVQRLTSSLYQDVTDEANLLKQLGQDGAFTPPSGPYRTIFNVPSPYTIKHGVTKALKKIRVELSTLSGHFGRTLEWIDSFGDIYDILISRPELCTKMRYENVSHRFMEYIEQSTLYFFSSLTDAIVSLNRASFAKDQCNLDMYENKIGFRILKKAELLNNERFCLEKGIVWLQTTVDQLDITSNHTYGHLFVHLGIQPVPGYSRPKQVGLLKTIENSACDFLTLEEYRKGFIRGAANLPNVLEAKYGITWTLADNGGELWDYIIALLGPKWDGYGNIQPKEMGFYWSELAGLRVHDIDSGLASHPWIQKLLEYQGIKKLGINLDPIRSYWKIDGDTLWAYSKLQLMGECEGGENDHVFVINHRFDSHGYLRLIHLLQERKGGQVFSEAVKGLLDDHFDEISSKVSESARRACAEEFHEDWLENEADKKLYEEVFLASEWNTFKDNPSLIVNFEFPVYKAKMLEYCEPFEAKKEKKISFSNFAFDKFIPDHLKLMKGKRSEKARVACANEFHDDRLLYIEEKILYDKIFRKAWDFGAGWSFEAYEAKIEELRPDEPGDEHFTDLKDSKADK